MYYKTCTVSDPVERYIKICIAHNTELNYSARREIEIFEQGYRQAFRDSNRVHLTYLFTTYADQYFLERGVTRPMCGGMLLDIEENGILDINLLKL